MNNMNFIVWMFPVIFMIHDFEEIILAEVWSIRYRKEINTIWPKRQPFGLKYIDSYYTPSFSIAVEVEFLIFSLISILSIIFQNYFLWYSTFLGLILHMIFIHILVCIWFKNYVPGVITSIILLFPSIWIMYKVEKILHYKMEIIMLACLLGSVMFIILIPMLHKLMGLCSKWLYKYSEVPK